MAKDLKSVPGASDFWPFSGTGKRRRPLALRSPSWIQTARRLLCAACLVCGYSLTQKAPNFILHPTQESHSGDSEDASRKGKCKHQRDALNLLQERELQRVTQSQDIGTFWNGWLHPDSWPILHNPWKLPEHITHILMGTRLSSLLSFLTQHLPKQVTYLMKYRGLTQGPGWRTLIILSYNATRLHSTTFSLPLQNDVFECLTYATLVFFLIYEI